MKLVSGSKVALKRFEDVVKCKDVAEFNRFVDEYLEERVLSSVQRHKTFWALFYRWKDAWLSHGT